MYITPVASDIPIPLKERRQGMVSLTETGAGAGAGTRAATAAAAEYEPMSKAEEADLDNNPWNVRGLIRYEERDLDYADRKVSEAALMDNPEEQRRHLQEVIEFFAAKYFMKFTVEGLLRNADLGFAYLHRMLAESVDDPEPGIDYRILKAEYMKKYGGDDV